MEDVRRSGQRILTVPRNPPCLPAVVARVHRGHPATGRARPGPGGPHRTGTAQIRRDAEQRRADALAAVPAGPDTPSLRAAMAVAAATGQMATSSSAQRSARRREAQQELARQALSSDIGAGTEYAGKAPWPGVAAGRGWSVSQAVGAVRVFGSGGVILVGCCWVGIDRSHRLPAVQACGAAAEAGRGVHAHCG